MNIYKDCIVSIKKIQLCKNEIIYNIYEILYKKRLMPNLRSSTVIKVNWNTYVTNFFFKPRMLCFLHVESDYTLFQARSHAF